MNDTKITIRPYNESDFTALQAEELSSTLARLYAARGVKNPEHTKAGLSSLLRPEALLNCNYAGELIAKAIAQGDSITILADYDTDGATACALIYDFLQSVGTNVNYLVPDRKIHGYGLTSQLVDLAAKDKPDWLITVDNGIASVDGVNHAKELGIKTIITDHHLPADELPDAKVIVNPNQPKCPFPSKHICGVGVIFYVATCIRKSLRELGWFDNKPEPQMESYLDLVALGTIADVVSLDLNNRILVNAGLKQIRERKCRPGIIALAEVARKSIDSISAQDLAFSIAPRLNAAGRMQNMATGIDCLLASNDMKANLLANELNSLNVERKEKEYQMRKKASKIVIATRNLNYIGHTYFHETWHEGLVGILASRIKDEINRPVIVFAPSINPLELKGSGRSIPNFHLRDALDMITKKHPNLIVRFGGHAMAAGLTIKKDYLEVFRQEFDAIAKKLITSNQLHKTIITDGHLEESITLAEAEEILSKVWGQGFEPPLFVDRFKITDQIGLKDDHKKLKMMNTVNLRTFDGIIFRNPKPIPEQITAVYQININTYRGTKSLQLIINNWFPCDLDQKNDKMRDG